jgi:hypothetical protein
MAFNFVTLLIYPLHFPFMGVFNFVIQEPSVNKQEETKACLVAKKIFFCLKRQVYSKLYHINLLDCGCIACIQLY